MDFDREVVKKLTHFWSSPFRVMPLALASPNRGRVINMAMSSNHWLNSPHNAKKVYVLHYEIRNSRSIRFFSTARGLTWMISFMILS